MTTTVSVIVPSSFQDYGTVLHSGYGASTERDEEKMKIALLERAEKIVAAYEENNS